ncbi:MAG TPA: cell division protein FtsL, partial [Treponemataceae bacterium]|nr:cell division protein FtsL [Treponemataceae bacterium]
EVKKLESVESALIENNKNLVAEISLLSSAERIESFAINELGMRKAGSDEIVRVEVKK